MGIYENKEHKSSNAIANSDEKNHHLFGATENLNPPQEKVISNPEQFNYSRTAIIQRLIDIDVPTGTKAYVSNRDSGYYEWKATIKAKSWRRGMLTVELTNPENWRARPLTTQMDIKDLTQIPDSGTDFSEDSLRETAESQLGGVKDRHLLGDLRGIVEGRFTGRKTEDGGIDTRSSPESIRMLRDQVLIFLNQARSLAHKVSTERTTTGKMLRLYRGMHSPQVFAMKPGHVFSEPLPFSTTFKKTFARQWSQTESENESVIMNIQVPANFPMIFLSTPSWLHDFSDNGGYVVNQGQQEVTLTPMELRITHEHMEGDHKVFDVIAEKPLSDEEVWDIFGAAAEESRHLREEAAEAERRFDELVRAAEYAYEEEDEEELDYTKDLAENWLSKHREFQF